jgi:lipopolysaccharide biosynthesis glycosyltransferase
VAPLLSIACASDDRYLPHCAAMLHSLATHHAAGTVAVHLLHDGLDPALLVPLGRFATTLGLVWSDHLVPDAVRARYPTHPRFGRSAWYRVALPEVLPDVERVVYLDADTIVTDDLAPLGSVDLAGHPLAAVTNALYPRTPLGFLADLGVPSPGDYFNSGVLVMQLEAWRRDDLTGAVQRFVDRGRGLDLWPDQSALNATLWDRRLHLAPRWNAQNTIFDLRPAQLPFTAAEVAEARRHPAVVHFIGPYKPWHHRSTHPLRDRYFEHRRQTPWPDQAIDGATVGQRALRLLPVPLGYQVEARVAHLRNRLFSKK